MADKTVIRLAPVFKELIWGGTKLRSYFNYDTPNEHTAEALVLSSRDNADCVDSEGTPLSEIYAARPEFFGSNCLKYDRFPLLIKLIDTMDDISVQVHPDDEYAASVSNEWGKAQLWYVVDCEPGAYLICGFNDEINIEDFRRRIEDDTLISAVNTYEVRKGDTFYIEPGTLHAIGKDILLAEIGQNSELSYRVYDYCRVDENGQTRPLNIQQALDVTITAPPTVPAGVMVPRAEIDGHYETLLGRCDIFASSLWEVEQNALISAPDNSFVSILMLDGTLRIDTLDVPLRKGDSALLAAGSKDISLIGMGKFIATVVE
jgi:Phosphomannose isomerase